MPGCNVLTFPCVNTNFILPKSNYSKLVSYQGCLLNIQREWFIHVQNPSTTCNQYPVGSSRCHLRRCILWHHITLKFQIRPWPATEVDKDYCRDFCFFFFPGKQRFQNTLQLPWFTGIFFLCNGKNKHAIAQPVNIFASLFVVHCMFMCGYAVLGMHLFLKTAWKAPNTYMKPRHIHQNNFPVLEKVMQAESPFTLPIPDRKQRTFLQNPPPVGTNAMFIWNYHQFHRTYTIHSWPIHRPCSLNTLHGCMLFSSQVWMHWTQLKKCYKTIQQFKHLL